MSGAKRVVKAIATGGASELERRAEKEAKRQAEEARRQAEEAARKQAELEAAQNAASTIATAKEEGVETVGETESKKKKSLRGGKKSLSVARSSGTGINL